MRNSIRATSMMSKFKSIVVAPLWFVLALVALPMMVWWDGEE